MYLGGPERDGDLFILGRNDLWCWQSALLEFSYFERAGSGAGRPGPVRLLRYSPHQAGRSGRDPAHVMSVLSAVGRRTTPASATREGYPAPPRRGRGPRRSVP
jgi:hypothetical protein